MKTKKISNYSIAMIAVVFSFVFSIPVFSGGPFPPHRHARPSAELRPVFFQLMGQAERTKASLIYHAGDYDVSTAENMAFTEASTSLEGLAHQIEKSLVYHAPATTEIEENEETDRILSVLQTMGKQMESSLAYSAPELNI